MFSRDPKHYRPMPRTIQQAFGPYHRFNVYQKRRAQIDMICAGLGVLGLGAMYGAMWYWGWL